MHPKLLEFDSFSIFGNQIHGFAIHSYGILIAFGFICAIWVGLRFCRQDKINYDQALDLGFWCLFSGLIGSRLMFSIVNARHYYNACFHPELPNFLNHGMPLQQAHCWSFLYLWEGGLVWYGGLIGALLAGVIFVRRNKLSTAKIADMAIGTVPLGHMIGRLACLMAGCCWGRVTDSPLGAVFPADSLPYRSDVLIGPSLPPLPLHPTQLYEAAGLFVIFLILLLVRHHRRFYGQVALTYLILYPILRSTLEFFRGDKSRGFLVQWQTTTVFDGVSYSDTIGISTSQAISFLVVCGAAIWMIYLYRKAKDSAA